ncbi:MAG: hypothetical protein AYK23_02065 [Candidatus Proteinoplasmatales archaeon SG8-5]|nr:MAG: hypothetical protein AYK23_02065 [Candidatus Proteinoplasmatales archaeon SG8-5]
MYNRRLIFALALSFSIIAMPYIITYNAQADLDELILVPGKYTGSNVYAPGETLTIVLRGDPNEVYSIYILGIIVGEWRSVNLGEDGETTAAFPIDEVTPDRNYTVQVRDYTNLIVANATFWVQGYVALIETDREAYLDGDTMNIFWTTNNLKDQSLANIGAAFIRIRNETNGLHHDIPINTSAGKISFTLPVLITNYEENYTVEGWFNDSFIPPRRTQYAKAQFHMKRLSVLVHLDKQQYTVGSLLTIEVKTVVTDNQSFPSVTDTSEPGCDVSISIFRLLNNLRLPTPIELISGLATDTHGQVSQIISLDDPLNYTDGSEYEIEVNAQKGGRSWKETTTFRIAESSSLSVVLDFDKELYASGDSILVNASVFSIGGGTEFTYLFEVRDTRANGTLFSRQTQTSGLFTFGIPDDFVEGWLWIKATVDDGEGNTASIEQQVKVVYAIILVNVEKETYVASEELDVSYEVISTKMSAPDIYYYVEDNEGNRVDEGVATAGIFTFTVPATPSSSYVFTVIASEGGRIVQGSDTAVLFSSYVLTLEFDKDIYSPGDPMMITYNVFVFGDANLPSTFIINYGLANVPLISLQTSQASGELAYIIPDNIDEGEQLFTAYCDFGGVVNEVIVIKSGANPLWYLKIGDIPIFTMLLFLLLIICMFWIYRTGRRITELQKTGITTAEKTRKLPLETAVQTVDCVECGSPIEITTSRRPIEVMCPHCGEIQHLDR